MRLAIFGADGQLGKTLPYIAQECPGITPLPFVAQAADITQADQVAAALRQAKPDAVVNCAAFTQVDACESEQERAFTVNASGAEILANACESARTALVYISTDYVFDGCKQAPYTEQDTPNPLQVYGHTKLNGEELCKKACQKLYIVRTSWLYGLHGGNFVKSVLRKALEGSFTDRPGEKRTLDGSRSKDSGDNNRDSRRLTVVSDQIGSPTNAEDLSRAILRLLETEQYGLCHYSGESPCSWYEYAKAILRVYGVSYPVSPCATGEYPAKAARPAYSYLDKSLYKSLTGLTVPGWQERLARFAGEYPLEALLAD